MPTQVCDTRNGCLPKWGYLPSILQRHHFFTQHDTCAICSQTCKVVKIKWTFVNQALHNRWYGIRITRIIILKHIIGWKKLDLNSFLAYELDACQKLRHDWNVSDFIDKESESITIPDSLKNFFLNRLSNSQKHFLERPFWPVAEVLKISDSYGLLLDEVEDWEELGIWNM